MRTARAAGSVWEMDDDSNAAKGSRGDGGSGACDAPASNGRRSPADDPVQRAIGEGLRAVFDEVVRQPVPERFAELLRKLAEQERDGK
jgi:hypothetical protein